MSDNNDNEGKPKRKRFRLLPKIIDGGVGGMIGIFCVFPMDLVKTRLQNQQTNLGIQEYSSIYDAFKKTLRHEGFFGMYRGSFVNMLLITPDKAVKLATNDMFRHYFTAKDGSLSLVRELAAAVCAGICGLSITTPMDLIKIQMQDAGRLNAQLRLSGKPLIDDRASTVVLNLIRQRGPFALWTGMVACAYRDIPFAVIYFPMFANLNKLSPRRSDGEGVFWATFLAGLASGTTAAWSVTPFDVIKTRIQTARKGKGEIVYTGVWDAVATILRKEGVKSFFKGGACRILVLGPLYAITQTVYYFGIGDWLLRLGR